MEKKIKGHIKRFRSDMLVENPVVRLIDVNEDTMILSDELVIELTERRTKTTLQVWLTVKRIIDNG